MGLDNDDLFNDDAPFQDELFEDADCGLEINPANGLPMLEGGMIDVMGNPYGMDDDISGDDQ